MYEAAKKTGAPTELLIYAIRFLKEHLKGAPEK